MCTHAKTRQEKYRIERIKQVSMTAPTDDERIKIICCHREKA